MHPTSDAGTLFMAAEDGKTWKDTGARGRAAINPNYNTDVLCNSIYEATPDGLGTRHLVKRMTPKKIKKAKQLARGWKPAANK